MIKAIIFDMDGVISDTNLLHTKIESKILKRYGIIISPEEIIKNYNGVPTRDTFSDLFKKNNISPPIDKLINEKWKETMKSVKHIKPIKGAIELIENLYRNKYNLAVASSSKKDFIIRVLDQLNIKNKFKIIVSGYEVKNGKPSPDIFILASKRLNIHPEEIMVIEDSLNGMIAAKNAGMKCIGPVLEKDYKDYPADIIVDSLEKITLNMIVSLNNN